MKKRMLLALTGLMGMAGVSAQTFTAANDEGVYIRYTVSSDGQSVEVATGGYNGRVYVPDSVAYDTMTYPVVAIGTSFRGTGVTWLRLPPTVRRIPYSAFFNCNRLDTVVLDVVDPTVFSVDFRNLSRPIVFVAPCGTLSAFRKNVAYLSTWRQLTTPCAEYLQFELDGGGPSDKIAVSYDSLWWNRYVSTDNGLWCEVGDTVWISPYREQEGDNSDVDTVDHETFFVGWSDGLFDPTRMHVVQQSDTFNAVFRPKHYGQIDVGAVSALVDFTGNLSYDGAYAQQRVNGAATIFSNALWVGSHEYVAKQTFPDLFYSYTPGPLDSDGTTNFATALEFARVWHVSREMIDYHIAHLGDAGYIPDDDILTWPGNSPFNPQEVLAPFYDADSDGLYNPFAGDYPLIRGDECTFSVFSHAGHSYQTISEYNMSGGFVDREIPFDGEPMGLEVHCMTYAFSEPGSTALNNTIFAHYDIINRSANTYDDTYLGLWTDFDLGYAFDDYVGCDVHRGMYYCYNGDDEDGPGEGAFYGAPPAQSCLILGGATLPADGQDNGKVNIDYILNGSNQSLIGLLDQYRVNGVLDTVAVNRDADLFYYYDPFCWRFTPGDTLGNLCLNGLGFGDGIADNERMGMTGFMYYDNGTNSVSGDPRNASDVYNYLSMHWKNGQHVRYGGNGSSGQGTEDINCQFMFCGDSDPWNWGTDGEMPTTMNWSEPGAGNVPGDRRGLASSGPFTFEAGATQQLDVAYTTAFGTSGAWSSVEVLRVYTDEVRAQFIHDTTASGRPFTYRPYSAPRPVGISPTPDASALRLYPNPATASVLVGGVEQGAQVSLVDIGGRTLRTLVAEGGELRIDLRGLPSGTYFVRVGTSRSSQVAKLVVK